MSPVWEVQKLRCTGDIDVAKSAESYKNVQRTELNINLGIISE